MSLRIYGASDDLVEIEGHYEDEIDCYGAEGVQVRVGDALLVTMRYTTNGVWSAEISQVDEDVQIPYPITVISEKYSVVVEVECLNGTTVVASVR